MPISLLRFDLRSPGFSPAKTDELYAAALELSAYADANGFDSISLSEHHGVDDGFLPSPLPLAGAIAGCTKRVRISISALLATLYDPVKLAEDLVVLDHVSRGRLNTTLGMGYREVEYAMFGRDFAARGKLLDECVELLLRAWRGEEFSWQGRRVRVTPAPFTQPHPPVLIGGQSAAGARRAARFGLPYQPASNDAAMVAVYEAECARLGVPSQLYLPGTGEMIWVSRDPDRSWAEIGRYLMHEASTYASWQPASQQRSTVHSRAASAEALRAEGLYRVLTPAECIARAKAGGPHTAFVLYPLCGGIPPALAWESVRIYVEEVLPALR